jgi:GNAT superfamily N-acetyltransferase
MTTIDPRLARLAEQGEAEALVRFEAQAPHSMATTMGIAHIRIGGGVALSVREDPSRFWSKALGFGFDEPITAALIARVCAFYRAQRSPSATIQIAPERLPADWDAICTAEGLAAAGSWIKLGCPVDAMRPGTSLLRVGPIAPDEGHWWATLVMRGFGLPVELAPMLAASVGTPGMTALGAWDGDELVATAHLSVHEDVGELQATVTLPEHRGRGAQSALIAACGSAAAAGCRWLVADTGRPDPGQPVPSLRNLMRAGLEPLYERVNWTRRPER